DNLTDAAPVRLLSCAESPRPDATRRDARQQRTIERRQSMRCRTSGRAVDHTIAERCPQLKARCSSVGNNTGVQRKGAPKRKRGASLAKSTREASICPVVSWV